MARLSDAPGRGEGLMSTPTREQAERALELLKKHYGSYVQDGYEPKLVQEWDWLDSGPTPWAIVWEEGPEEWALSFWEAANPGEYQEIEEWGSDVYASPVTSWAVSLHL